MTIYVNAGTELGEFFAHEWPDTYRIPVVGELLMLGVETYTVETVQWEFQDGAWSVQLRVRRG